MFKCGKASKNSLIRLYSSLHKIQPIVPKEKDEILKFMRSWFIKDEPLCKSLKIFDSGDEKTVGWDNYFASVIENGDANKIEDSGKIIAVGLFSLITKGKGIKGLPRYENDPSYEKICKLVEFIENKVDIFNKLNIDKYYYIDCVGIHKDYRKLGLLQLLVDQSEKRARSLGCKYLTTLTSGAYSKAGCVNIGMKEIFSLKYKDYKVNGEIVFETEPPHTEATYCVKQI